jgi:hypothetical protein
MRRGGGSICVSDSGDRLSQCHWPKMKGGQEPRIPGWQVSLKLLEISNSPGETQVDSDLHMVGSLAAGSGLLWWPGKWPS